MSYDFCPLHRVSCTAHRSMRLLSSVLASSLCRPNMVPTFRDAKRMKVGASLFSRRRPCDGNPCPFFTSTGPCQRASLKGDALALLLYSVKDFKSIDKIVTLGFYGRLVTEPITKHFSATASVCRDPGKGTLTRYYQPDQLDQGFLKRCYSSITHPFP